MKANKVVALSPRDRIRQDAKPIAELYRSLGTASAEQVVTRSLAELAMTMAGMSRQVRQHDLDDISRQLRKLQSMAEHLGLVSLGQVADDVRTCLDRSDATAFAAVWARLLRVAGQCLSPDRDLLDKSLH